jgi:shikimate kinase/3-dehydroquinate synthase
MTLPLSPPRIVSFVGQMGSGKSTLAQALAARLGATPAFRHQVGAIDLDAELAADLGMPIADFFALHGEPAFRERERAVLLELLANLPDNRVTLLATGGGAPCNDIAVDALTAAGPSVWLDAAAEILAARALTPDRPLLAGHDHASAARMLADQRKIRAPFYRRADLHLDASMPVEGLVDQVLARYFPGVLPPAPTIPMPPPLDVALPAESVVAHYPIHFVAGLPGPTVAEIARTRLAGARRLLVVTDDNVAPVYLADFVAEIEALSVIDHVATHILPAGETSKELQHLAAILDTALGAAITRQDALIALGGGVVGDITGLAAALLHRGVRFVQVPTTLLAQVDSAVGGKTAINHGAGKNLIGAFHHPVAVVASQQVLRTLPPREIRCGMAEAIKHAFIADAPFIDWIREHRDALVALDPSAVAHLVHRCCSIKRDIVVQDPREQGVRALLNFGHTLGHAYEKLLGYGTLTHGEAVALGMVHAARLSDALQPGSAFETAVRAVLAPFGFELDIDSPALPSRDTLIAAAINDKKADATGSVRFIVLEALGRAAIARLDWASVAQLLASGGARP